MSDRIWKFPLPDPGCEKYLHIGTHAQVRSVGLDPKGTPCAWVQVNPEHPAIGRRFTVIGTGHDVPPLATFCGTYQDGPFVWHVFEVIS